MSGFVQVLKHCCTGRFQNPQSLRSFIATLDSRMLRFKAMSINGYHVLSDTRAHTRSRAIIPATSGRVSRTERQSPCLLNLENQHGRLDAPSCDAFRRQIYCNLPLNHIHPSSHFVTYLHLPFPLALLRHTRLLHFTRTIPDLCGNP